FWEPVYERFIRRAAGLGRASKDPDPDHYEHAHAHCDVLVVGAGPTGLMAALAAGQSGARVLLIDENPSLGGSLNRDHETIDDQPADQWRESIEQKLSDCEELTVMRRTTVAGYYDHNVLVAAERVGDNLAEPPPHQPRQRLWTIRAKEVVLATGAHERPMVFPNNDRPGVMLASAVRTYLNQFGVACGRNVIVATNNDDAYRTAIDLAEAGIRVPVIADARKEPGSIAETARAKGIEVWTETQPLKAHGRHQISGITLGQPGDDHPHDVACDCLAISGGYSPAVHLSSQSGPKPVWREDIQAFVPGPSRQRERSAGAGNGYFDLADCLQQGLTAGKEAAKEAGFAKSRLRGPKVEARSEAPLVPLWQIAVKGKAFVDQQNDVTASDVRLAAQEGYRSVEHAKRYTTLGMAPDQGKTSNINGLAILADARGTAIPEVGTTTFRPPYTPVAIGAFAGHERGMTFQPIRRTAMHEWHERNGAVFVEAGQWIRPSHYPISDESLMEACTREAHQVRQSVGLCDVSTLGKIEIFGPDSAEFLNRLYTNGWSKLAVGKARYGLMLREDGHVFDDGTTSRLADDHFFMTTTTANAARVLAHMEQHHQTVWPELDVCFCSATEQWCGMALAGPKSRDVLAAIVDDTDVSNKALPFMGVVDASAGGIPIRIFRISFSGELAYEIDTAWGYGETIWQRCINAGKAFDIVPYGTEALSIMRIEKGHVAGQELDGRTTAADLGMPRMMSTKKPFIGKSMASRPGMVDPDRPSLVGIKPVNRQSRLRGGALLVSDVKTATTDNRQGWVRSVHWSPAMNSYIGLAFIKGGSARIGETVTAYYPLKNEATEYLPPNRQRGFFQAIFSGCPMYASGANQFAVAPYQSDPISPCGLNASTSTIIRNVSTTA
ncbi:MAG: sarcosine oxidase subunit alpha family protein, partial [Pseudomonadota bacterium]